MNTGIELDWKWWAGKHMMEVIVKVDDGISYETEWNRLDTLATVRSVIESNDGDSTNCCYVFCHWCLI